MDWYELTEHYHEQTFARDGDLESLPEPWQRELAAVWRLEADVNNGGYLQFLANWGLPARRYAFEALNKMGASQMARIVADCYAALNAAAPVDKLTRHELSQMLPNPLVDEQGRTIKEAGSTLPNDVLTTLYDLSYEFMDYPDDLPELGLSYYSALAANQA